jgi:acetyl esterase
MQSAKQMQDFLREIGPRWGQDVANNVKRVIAQYDPLLAAAPKEGVKVVRDIAYGADPRQQLDVFSPEHGQGRAVVIFVHGGAFTDGDRNRSAEVYSNILYYLARHGIVGLNIEYRQAPQYKYPAGTEDVALAFHWAHRHIHEFGGSAERIFLMGHSAGASHAGSLVYNHEFQSLMPCQPKGLIVVSGRVRADNLAENPNARKVEAYYGTDADFLAQVSPVAHITADSLPTFIAYAQYENPLIDVYCLELAHCLAKAKRRAPPVIRLAEHNHTSIIAHINTDEDLLGKEIVRFIADHGGPDGIVD